MHIELGQTGSKWPQTSKTAADVILKFRLFHCMVANANMVDMYLLPLKYYVATL